MVNDYINLVARSIKVRSGAKLVTQVPKQTPLPRRTPFGKGGRHFEVVLPHEHLAIVVENRFASPTGKILARTVPHGMRKQNAIACFGEDLGRTWRSRSDRSVGIERNLLPMTPGKEC